MVNFKIIFCSALLFVGISADNDFKSEQRFNSKLFRTCAKIGNSVKESTKKVATGVKNHKKKIMIGTTAALSLIPIAGFWNLYVMENKRIIKGNDKNTIWESMAGAPFDGLSQLFDTIRSLSSFERLNSGLETMTNGLDYIVKEYCTGREGFYVQD